MADEACALCAFYREPRCCEGSPKLLPDGAEGVWPEVAPDRWCGRFEPDERDPLAQLAELAEDWLAGVTDGEADTWPGGPKGARPPKLDPSWAQLATYRPDAAAPALEVWGHGDELWTVREVEGRHFAVMVLGGE
jgi:hypothetical protein